MTDAVHAVAEVAAWAAVTALVGDGDHAPDYDGSNVGNHPNQIIIHYFKLDNSLQQDQF